MAFKGLPPSTKPHCLHQNGNPEDNRIENLRWGNAFDNYLDARQHGRCPFGKGRNGYKLTPKEVKEIHRLSKKGTHRPKLAKKYSVSLRTIYEIISGRTWKSLL